MTHTLKFANRELSDYIEVLERNGFGWSLHYDADGRCYSSYLSWWENDRWERIASNMCFETPLAALKRGMENVSKFHDPEIHLYQNNPVEPPSSTVRVGIDLILKQWDEGRLTPEQAAIFIANSIVFTSNTVKGPHNTLIGRLLLLAEDLLKVTTQ